MIIYYQEDHLLIRSMIQTDADEIFAAYQKLGHHRSADIFTGYFNQQEQGIKQVIVAEVDGEIAGYVTLLPEVDEGPYAGQGIPAIVDFSVFDQYQRRGIGTKILEITEQLAGELSNAVCLAVGLHSGYGSAQRMYIKRGYIPDGSGVWYHDKPLDKYAPCVNDDDLLLHLKKEIQPAVKKI